MADLKLFTISKGKATEILGKSMEVEKSLQLLIEKNLESFLGVRFLASEYPTGKKHGGRIDTLGIDENGCPVIIEYKRSTNENVINQGLFYLDWLMDHKAEFQMLVMNNKGKGHVETIEWSSPRLLCIAGDYTKYDEYAVQQIDRNIELIRYKSYGPDLLLLELTNVTVASPGPGGKKHYSKFETLIKKAPKEQLDLYESLKAFLMALGDDVQMKVLNYYVVFKRMKNFASVEVHPKSGKIVAFLKVDPGSIKQEKGFTRDVTEIGHYGTGDLEVTIACDDDLEKAKPLFVKSYESS